MGICICGALAERSYVEGGATFIDRHRIECPSAHDHVPGVEPLPMFDTDEVPYVTGSSTSKNAAHAITGEAVTLREALWLWLCEHGPATDEEMAEKLGMNPNTQRPRRRELEKEGRVRKAGKHRTRSGATADLWSAVS